MGLRRFPWKLARSLGSFWVTILRGRGPIPQRKGRSDVCPSKQSEWRRCPLCAEPLPLLRCDDFTVAACPQTPPSQRSCVDDYKDGGALRC